MLIFEAIVLILLCFVGSALPLIAKRMVKPSYGEYAAWLTIFLTCGLIASLSVFWFPKVDIMTAFVRSVIIVALPYGSSLHWINRTLLPSEDNKAKKTDLLSKLHDHTEF